ncbi:biphenyl 2,3-dioxygenase [Methanocella sp. CWC-04]|uniref:Biphenyl 2,3-dioxygenase n=1 Tax=Methanooceanicella nereidis TaxID=2052831 RepID=A0AAP2RE48_9EURY|nr:Rieske 2Fe-2S domain-containing protein [Methanocella sp. CWC-04]MCD1294385.1 biphenyl 2,3-dioxygenase [Methanocella sp. CWC-04]
MSDFTKLTSVKEIAPGSMKRFTVGDKNIVIANIGGNFHAFEDKCPHLSAKLSTGLLLGNNLTCMSHGARFDIITGKPDSVTDKPLNKLEVKVEGDDVYVKV